MTPAELHAAFTSLGWRQNDLCRRLGVTPTTVSRWSTGATPIPVYASAYLRLASDIHALGVNVARKKGGP